MEILHTDLHRLRGHAMERLVKIAALCVGANRFM